MLLRCACAACSACTLAGACQLRVARSPCVCSHARTHSLTRCRSCSCLHRLHCNSCRYKLQLDHALQHKQHEKWERLFIERVQYKKVSAVSQPDNARAPWRDVCSETPRCTAASMSHTLWLISVSSLSLNLTSQTHAPLARPCPCPCPFHSLHFPQDRFIMFRDMHLTRNKQLARLHERLGRELHRSRLDDNDRRLEALKANDFEAYRELLRQTYGPLSDDDRFAGATARPRPYRLCRGRTALSRPRCRTAFVAAASASLAARHACPHCASRRACLQRCCAAALPAKGAEIRASSTCILTFSQHMHSHSTSRCNARIALRMRAEVERFLTETEQYIDKLTKKLVEYKATEAAGDAVQEAIAEVRRALRRAFRNCACMEC